LQSEPRLNYVGYSGHGNTGDVVLLYSIKRLFSKYTFFPNYENTFSKITLFGGGTLLPLWHILPNKYNYVFGTSVWDPAFNGKSDFDPILIRRLKSFNFRLIGVRDNFSQKMLAKHGVSSQVIGDPCLSLKASSVKRNDLKVAISIGLVEDLWGQNENRVFEEISKLCKELKKNSFIPVLVPFNASDVPIIKNFCSLNDLCFFENWHNLNALLDFIASCKLLIGEKLHSLVFSAAVYTPFLPIEYRPKCFHFAESVGFDKYCHKTSNLTSQGLLDTFNSLINNWETLHASLRTQVNVYRRKQQEFANLIIEDIEQLPSDKWVHPNLSKQFINHTVLKIDDFTYKSIKVWQLWNKYFLLPSMSKLY
jgi:hypothetical protein